MSETRERARGPRVARIAPLLLGVLALVAGGCIVYRPPAPKTVVVQAPPHRHGPPPHAPAHGYRRKNPQDGVELSYDGDLEVYAVVGRTGVYWDGNRYLLWRDGSWRVSARIDGVWVSIGSDKVPPRLVARYAAEREDEHGKGRGHGAKRGRGWGNYPAKHDD